MRINFENIPCSRGMCDNISPNRLLRVSSEHGSSIDLCNHLICNHHSNSKLKKNVTGTINLK